MDINASMGITDPVFVGIGLVIAVAFVFFGFRLGLKINAPAPLVIWGSLLLVGSFIVWRSFSPFLLPKLAPQALIAVLGMHVGFGLYCGVVTRVIVEQTKKRVMDALDKFLATCENSLPGPQFSTALRQVIAIAFDPPKPSNKK